MIRMSFNGGWEFRPKVSSFAELGGASVPYRPVTLPHDAMLGQERVAQDGADLRGGANAYFPGGAFEYRKVFTVPEEDRGSRVLLEFEGVYRDAMVYVNGDYAGQRPYGYSLFRVDADRFLRFGQDNEIRVEARAHQDSRWYTGAGIYRDTWLLTGGPVRIGPDGVRVATPDIDGERAVVEVATRVENDSIAIRTVGVVAEILDAAGTVVAADTCQISVLPGEPATARQRLYVRAPRLWSTESPALHAARVRLTDGDAGGEADAETVTFGIRSLRLDPDHGLRINDETVKLRGACVHHDNGVLGAATFARAEERRVQLLKDAGFNAIRMSHHPMSKHMLDACDRLGVLVMDEAFDMWTSAKSDFDYSLNFPQWWERDIEAMVAKDVNHPSVILYSIGNEIPETGSPAGAAWGRKLAEKVRSLDGTRYVTNAVNGMLAVLDALAAMRAQPSENAGINALMADPADMMNAISSSDLVTRRTAESFSVLDVAGINYAEARYDLDRDLFPNRIIVGSETFPTRIDGNWRLVRQHGNVIGDFTWTGWDYLGEAGIGRPQYATADGSRPAFTAPYPYLLAGCGDIDITGHRAGLLLPPDRLRTARAALPGGPASGASRPDLHRDPVGVERLRRQLDLARVRRRAGQRRGLQRRRRGGTPRQRPFTGATARWGRPSVPRGIRGGLRTGRTRRRRLRQRRGNRPPCPAVRRRPGAAPGRGRPAGHLRGRRRPRVRRPHPDRRGRNLLHQGRPAGHGRGLGTGRPARLRQRRALHRGAIRRDRAPYPRRTGPRRPPPHQPGEDPPARLCGRMRADRSPGHRRMMARRPPPAPESGSAVRPHSRHLPFGIILGRGLEVGIDRA